MLKVVEQAGTDQENGGLEGKSLDELAREGAQRMIAAALDEEVEAFLARHRDERNGRGHAQVVRNGRARPRKVTTGAGTMEIQAHGSTIGERERSSRAGFFLPT